MGRASNGNYIYKWTYSGSLTSAPSKVIFTHNGENKFSNADGTFTNHGYYTESNATQTVRTITVVKNSGTTSKNESLGKVVIYYNNPNRWDQVCYYIYNGEKDNISAWPGLIMKKNDNISHNGVMGWWMIEVPANYANALFIINDGNVNQYPASMQPGVQLNGKSIWLNNETVETEGIAYSKMYSTTDIKSSHSVNVEVVNVYSVSGKLLKRGVRANDCLNGLSKGSYIVNGKKVIK